MVFRKFFKRITRRFRRVKFETHQYEIVQEYPTIADIGFACVIVTADTASELGNKVADYKNYQLHGGPFFDSKNSLYCQAVVTYIADK